MTPVPLAIVVALDEEIRVLQSKMEVDARVHVRPALFTIGTLKDRPLIVARSGIGIPAMASAGWLPGLSQIQAGTLRFILVGVALMLLVIFMPQGLLGNKKELTFVK